MREPLRLVAIVRLDHFRGFSACWEVPATHTTAENGAWVETPGQELLRAMQDGLGGDLPLIAEDLGMLTPVLLLLRDESALPGMRVLQFAFGSDAGNPHLPHQYAPSVV